METMLTTSIEPIEVAFVRAGLPAALDVAAVQGVESGTLALEGKSLRTLDAARAPNALTAAFVEALGTGEQRWSAARAEAKARARGAVAALERALIARGFLREPSPWRWIAGRRTDRGFRWLQAARLAYPAAQIAASDPALALALHGPRALDGTRYHAATVAAASTASGSDGGGCGATFFGDGGSGGHGDGGGGHGDGGGSCGSGGCGGGGCGG